MYAKLKRLVADLSLDKGILQDVVGKNRVRPAGQRDMVRYLQGSYDISERRACRVSGCLRSSLRYQAHRNPRAPLRARIREIAEARVRYGYRRIHVLLAREGWHANHKLIYRLYREEGLALRRKRPKRDVSGTHQEVRTRAAHAMKPGAWTSFPISLWTPGADHGGRVHQGVPCDR